MKKKILITGSSGFWGYNQINYFLEKNNNFEITCVYNTNKNSLKELNNIKKIQCNLEDDSEIIKLGDDYDIILHLASVIEHTNDNSEKNININVNSSKNIFELARLIGKNKSIKVICASTIGTVACFNTNNESANEESKFSMNSFNFPYYKSKILIEKMANKYRSNNIEIIFIRPPVIYGENDLKGRATSRIKKFLDKKIILYTKGNIPFCDINDLTKITNDIICKEKNEKIYNIDGYQITIKKFYEILEELSGEKKIKIYIPYYFGLVFILIFRNLIKLPDIIELKMGNCFWNSKSKYFEEFKWTDYKTTLKKSIDYIRKSDNKREYNTSNTNYLYLFIFLSFLSFLFLPKIYPI